MYRPHSAEELAAISEGRLVMGNPAATAVGVAIDSRRVRQGDLFVAITGQRVDGHDFLAEAADAGASCALVRRVPGPVPGLSMIQVPDPVIALGRIALAIRARFSPLAVGITGSVGKTTTKDMTASVAGARFRTLKTEGNLNTDIGVPLALVELGPEHEVMVVEMGMRGRGQISYLAGLVQPQIGVITNVGPAHMELTGSIDATARYKRELLESLPGDGVAVINADDLWCEWMIDGLAARVIRYSVRSGADIGVQGLEVSRRGLSFLLVVGGQRARVTMTAWGRQLVPAALAAAGAGSALGMDIEEIAAGLAAFRPAPMRSQLISVGGWDLIDDTYNAAPESMAAALGLLGDLEASRRAAVLGPMLELGDRASTAHRNLGARAATIDLDLLVGVGDLGRFIVEGAVAAGMKRERTVWASGNESAAETVKAWVSKGDLVLVKGSRAAAMDEIVTRLRGEEG